MSTKINITCEILLRIIESFFNPEIKFFINIETVNLIGFLAIILIISGTTQNVFPGRTGRILGITLGLMMALSLVKLPPPEAVA